MAERSAAFMTWCDARGAGRQSVHRLYTAPPHHMPFAQNQSTASRSAWSTGVWGSPSSRSAFEGSKNIRLAAIRTAVRATAGSVPRKRATHSAPAPIASAARCGRRTRGARMPV